MVLIDSVTSLSQQSGLTGGGAVEKVLSQKADSQIDSLLESESLAFMGFNVISGRATALVLVVGDETMMGTIGQTINTIVDQPFEREIEYHLNVIRLMLVMVPVVFNDQWSHRW